MKVTSLKNPLKVYRPTVHENSDFSIGGIGVGSRVFPLVVIVDDRRYCFDMTVEEGEELVKQLKYAIKSSKGGVRWEEQ